MKNYHNIPADTFVFSLLQTISRQTFREAAFIEHFCRGCIPEDSSASVYSSNDLPTKINQDKIINLLRHNQLQIIWSKVIKSGRDLPKDISRIMALDSLTLQLFIQKQRQEYSRLLHIFKKESHNFIVLKTYILFSDDSIKLPGDLDLLIPISQFPAISAILKKQGYQPYVSHRIKSSSDSYLEKYYIPKQEEIFKKGQYTVELHTALVDTTVFISKLFTDEANKRLTQKLASDTQWILYKGIRIQIFTPTSLLLSLFIHHIYQHNYQSAVRYYEVARIINMYGPAIRWDNIFKTVEEYHLTPYFLWFLCFLHDLFPYCLPDNLVTTVIAYRRALNIIQLFCYFYMKKRLFYPVSPYSNFQKRICWAIINKQLSLSMVNYFIKRR